MEELPINYFDDVAADVDTLPAGERLIAQVNEASRLKSEVARLTKELAETEELLNRILREGIPEIMAELNMDVTKLSDGRQIEIKKSAKFTVKEMDRPAFFDWLEKTENDGIIKTAVVCEFGRGEIEAAREAVKTLESEGWMPALNRDVHYQTLQSFCKEQQEKEVKLPDCVGIFEFKEAKIKEPKSKKK